MSERTPQQLASEFISLMTENEILPLDDRDLPDDILFERRRRVIENGSSYTPEIEKLLNEAPISEFFRKQIIHEANLGNGTALPDRKMLIKELEYFFGISVNEGRAGIFDQEESFATEKRYFDGILPLLKVRERLWMENPVSWQEWEEDIISREKLNPR